MTINIKFMAKTHAEQDPQLWTSLLPGTDQRWGDCVFTFDMDARDYDWLVVYEGLPMLPNDRQVNRIEPLACPREKTLFITTEPASIRVEGPHYLRQYGHVLSAKPASVMKHPNQIFETPPLRWFYGRPLGGQPGEYINYDEFLARAPLPKTKTLSTVCSNKQMSHTVHSQRYNFTMEMKDRLGDMFDVYGRGINPIDRKDEAMDDYRYTLAIENHHAAGHWTEKLSDAWLANCLPFYYGDPEYASFFPVEAAIPIDIFKMDEAEATIRHSIARGEYEKRLPAIWEARTLILKKYNLIAVIAKTVERLDPLAVPSSSYGGEILGRHVFRKKHPFFALSDAIHGLKTRHFLSNS
ncbi:glycosyltransferase family 10 domain-containing protein [Litorimonas haliclonae]|uniref:glycosyltransferase family 10 domain-containing protein n=1 Tax=Litorimonas haliclonae TaxID=2081977 RepID=UPI0039EE362E